VACFEWKKERSEEGIEHSEGGWSLLLRLTENRKERKVEWRRLSAAARGRQLVARQWSKAERCRWLGCQGRHALSHAYMWANMHSGSVRCSHVQAKGSPSACELERANGMLRN
jgi:hypothetical protein